MVVKMAQQDKTLWSVVGPLTNFFDVRRKVRKCWRLWTITPGICWIDKIKFTYKKGLFTCVIAWESDITYYHDRKLCQV